MLHVHCKTPVAILLAAVADDRDLRRFPQNGGALPGLVFEVSPGLPINIQLLETLWAHVGEKLKGVDIIQEFAGEAELPDGRAATVYLATVNGRRELSGDAPTMPEILRGMAKDRNRLPYLKAWQVLTGSLTLNTKAIELDELKKHLDS
jgi:hypothetical protein